MVTAMTDHLKNWALWTAVGIAVLFLQACLENQHSETDALQRSADISNQLAAEAVAMKE